MHYGPQQHVATMGLCAQKSHGPACAMVKGSEALMARVLMLRIPFSSVIHTIAFTTTFLLASVGTPPLVSFALDQVTTAITHTTGAGNLGTRMTTDGHTIQITGGTRSDYGTGTNLFHSFDQFSVGSLDTAKFVNNDAIDSDFQHTWPGHRSQSVEHLWDH